MQPDHIIREIYNPDSAIRPGKVNGHGPDKPAVDLLPGTAYEPEPIRWLWPGWLALGKLHLLAGAPGSGKSTAGVCLAAVLTTGGRWPDGMIAPRGSVLVWTGEDGIADTLLPRFLAAGGDRNRIYFVDSARENGQPRPFDPATDMPALIEAAKDIADLRLVILDPVVSAITGDSHKNTETRRGLQPVVELAEAVSCAVLGITHLSKGTAGKEPLERIAGSIAFGAVPRVALATVKPADQSEPRRLIRAKSNIGPDSGGVEYTLHMAPVPGHEMHAQVIEWGELLEGSAKDLMAVEQAENESEREEAEAFLLDTLRHGPVPTREIKVAAVAHGHSWRTLNRAKRDLGVNALKLGMKDGWAWELPATPGPGADHETD